MPGLAAPQFSAGAGRGNEGDSMFKGDYSRVEKVRSDLDDIECEYLRAHGWKHTSSTPGSYWLWEKTLPDGRVALLQQSFAVTIQTHLTGE